MATSQLDNFGQISIEHRHALQWFEDNTGLVLPWRELQQQADDGNRVATLAKGIYKPAYSDYALSIRQTLTSPYADKEIVQRPDGSWVYPYFQENSDPSARDQEATNRGLMKCLRDGVPIGVLIQTKPKPGVEYLVLGLGRVRDWQDGYFVIERYDAGRTPSTVKDAALDWVAAETEVSPPPPTSDVREWQIRQILRRRGQARFRLSLIKAYDGRCAITGCNALDALEAAHIAPYNESINNNIGNGLLLRADLHTLFDLGLIAIGPSDLTVIVSPKLASSPYGELAGTRLRMPQSPSEQPSVQALTDHAIWAGLL
jgi:hypothetical protein